jgi:hypothetical protein
MLAERRVLARSGRLAALPRTAAWASCGLMQCGKAASLDHLVGDGENTRRHLDPKCPRRLNNHRPAGAGEAGGRAAGSVRST